MHGTSGSSAVPVAPRVLIVNAYSARNRGDGMIVSQMVRQFRAQGCDVRVMSDDPDDEGRYGIPRVPPLTPVWASEAAPVSAAGRGLSALRAWFVGHDPSGSLDWCDVCVSAGGGYLYDDGGNASRLNLVRRLAILRAARRSDTPVVLFSQSIGPFSSVIARQLVARELRRATLVIARERISWEVCDRMDVERLELCDDVAFALEPNAAPAIGAYRGAIGVTVMNALPGVDADGYRRYRRALVEGLADSAACRRSRVAVISQVSAHAGDDDVTAAREVVEELAALGTAADFVDLGDASDGEVAAFYGQLDLVVASRLHWGSWRSAPAPRSSH